MKTSKMLSFLLVFVFFNAFTQSDSARGIDSVQKLASTDTVYYKRAMKKNWTFTLSRLRVFEKRKRMEAYSDSVSSKLLTDIETKLHSDSLKSNK